MDVNLLSIDQNALVQKIARNQGLKTFKLKSSSGSAKGDNALGVLTMVSVENEDQNLQLVVKSVAKSEKLRKVFPIRKAYLREIYIYETIFPAFTLLQEEEDFPNGFSGYAKIYASCSSDFNEFLIMENLKTQGYAMWDKRNPMPADHIELALREYGKFHATSFALKDKKPEVFQKLAENLGNIFEYSDSTEGMVGMSLIKSIIKIGLKAVKGNKMATEAIERFSLGARKFMFEDMGVKEDQLAILHVDCWCNNLLFKYEGGQVEKPSKVCLIDWQLSMIGSPAVDLAHFLFTCAPKEVLSNFRRYLQIYHKSLTDTLKGLHCDPERLFPFSLLMKHWQKYAKFGIYQSLLIVKLNVSEGDESLDLAEIADSGKDFAKEIGFDASNDEKYRRRILDAITVAVQNDWL